MPLTATLSPSRVGHRQIPHSPCPRGPPRATPPPAPTCLWTPVWVGPRPPTCAEPVRARRGAPGSRGLSSHPSGPMRHGCLLDAAAGAWGGGEPTGARGAQAAACSPPCPALVRGTGLEPGPNLSALGSGPDVLPRGLGRSVPTPPRCQLAGVPGAALADRPLGPRAAPPTRHRGSARPRAAPSHLGPWVGLRQPRLFGTWFGGLASPHPSPPWASPIPCPAGHTGVPRGLPGLASPGRGPGLKAVGGGGQAWAQGLVPGSSSPESLPWETGSPNADKDAGRVTQPAPLGCASQAAASESQAPKDR